MPRRTVAVQRRPNASTSNFTKDEIPIGNGLIVTIIVGIIAGFQAGKIMKGFGYGVLMDLVVSLADPLR